MKQWLAASQVPRLYFVSEADSQFDKYMAKIFRREYWRERLLHKKKRIKLSDYLSFWMDID